MLLFWLRGGSVCSTIDGQFQLTSGGFRPLVSEVTLGEIEAFAMSSSWGKNRRQALLQSLDHITEINSKEHVLLQCVDIILGAMAFRLNDLHKVKPEGASRRGKRTLAKDRLYRHILAEIRTLKPSFNPKVSTAREPGRRGALKHLSPKQERNPLHTASSPPNRQNTQSLARTGAH